MSAPIIPTGACITLSYCILSPGMRHGPGRADGRLSRAIMRIRYSWKSIVKYMKTERINVMRAIPSKHTSTY